MLLLQGPQLEVVKGPPCGNNYRAPYRLSPALVSVIGKRIRMRKA